jgi:hypothetical protein
MVERDREDPLVPLEFQAPQPHRHQSSLLIHSIGVGLVGYTIPFVVEQKAPGLITAVMFAVGGFLAAYFAPRPR